MFKMRKQKQHGGNVWSSRTIPYLVKTKHSISTVKHSGKKEIIWACLAATRPGKQLTTLKAEYF